MGPTTVLARQMESDVARQNGISSFYEFFSSIVLPLQKQWIEAGGSGKRHLAVTNLQVRMEPARSEIQDRADGACMEPLFFATHRLAGDFSNWECRKLIQQILPYAVNTFLSANLGFRLRNDERLSCVQRNVWDLPLLSTNIPNVMVDSCDLHGSLESAVSSRGLERPSCLSCSHRAASY